MRIIPTLNKDGFLPLLFSILGALGGGATGIAKAVNDAKTIKLEFEEQYPNRPLSILDLLRYAAKLKLPYFPVMFCKDELSRKIRKRECGIINFDKRSGDGTHWMAYTKFGTHINYFDSCGN